LLLVIAARAARPDERLRSISEGKPWTEQRTELPQKESSPYHVQTPSYAPLRIFQMLDHFLYNWVPGLLVTGEC
jgi:hypothetical protein